MASKCLMIRHSCQCTLYIFCTQYMLCGPDEEFVHIAQCKGLVTDVVITGYYAKPDQVSKTEPWPEGLKCYYWQPVIQLPSHPTRRRSLVARTSVPLACHMVQFTDLVRLAYIQWLLPYALWSEQPTHFCPYHFGYCTYLLCLSLLQDGATLLSRAVTGGNIEAIAWLTQECNMDVWSLNVR